MKTTRLIFITLILAAMLLPDILSAQQWGGRRKPSVWDNWSVTANAGLTSFYGDLSIYDTDLMKKFSEESGPAMGVVISKYFNDKIGVSTQFLMGGLKGEDVRGTSFESSFYEYNFHFRVELINTLFPNNLTGFGMNLYAGVGQFVFKTTKWEMVDGEEKIYEKHTRVPEFVYFVGTGFQYKFKDKYGISLDVALRQARNDYLDYEVKNGNYDYYTHLNLGLTYYIQSFKGGQYQRGSYTRRKIPGKLPMRRRR